MAYALVDYQIHNFLTHDTITPLEVCTPPHSHIWIPTSLFLGSFSIDSKKKMNYRYYKFLPHKDILRLQI